MSMCLEVMEIDEIVMVDVAKENREAGYNPAPDGTLMVITEWSESIYGRTQNFGHGPGVFESRTAAWVRPVGQEVAYAKPILISSFHLSPYLKDQYEERRNAVFASGKNMLNFREPVRLRDLPETKFWEWDIVECPGFEEGTQFRIEGIEWYWKEEGQEFTYRLTPHPDGGYTTYASESQLVMVERGKVWRHFHGEPNTFADLQDECRFAKALGEYDEVRNPANNLYKWTLAEILEAIRQDIVDGFSLDTVPFSGSTTHTTHRFRNRDLGKRVQAATLEGFANSDPVVVENKLRENESSMI